MITIMWLVAIAAAVAIWRTLYRQALLWFTRGRITPSWNLAASSLCYLALIPVVTLMSSGVVTLANHIQPVPYSNWIMVGMTVLVVVITAPQMIARGKVYAIHIEEEAQQKLAAQGIQNSQRG